MTRSPFQGAAQQRYRCRIRRRSAQSRAVDRGRPARRGARTVGLDSGRFAIGALRVARDTELRSLFRKRRPGRIFSLVHPPHPGTPTVLTDLAAARAVLAGHLTHQPSEAVMQVETNERADAALPMPLPPAPPKTLPPVIPPLKKGGAGGFQLAPVATGAKWHPACCCTGARTPAGDCECSSAAKRSRNAGNCQCARTCSVIFMRAPGFGGAEDGRSFHGVLHVESERYTLGLRNNSHVKPEMTRERPR